MLFRDRNHAAAELAAALGRYRGKKPLVVGIPRGGVVLAAAIARELGGDLDVVLVHKLRHPRSPEVAVGAVDETGQVYLNEAARGAREVSRRYLEDETARQGVALQARRNVYSPVRPPVDPRGRVVIVVDDGLATGATMKAALQSLRDRGAARLVAAVPVAPHGSIETLDPLTDEVVCLESPGYFHAVSQAYERFAQVEEEEVIRLLAEGAAPGAEGMPPDAVVLDFDGVIADTEPLHYQAFQQVLAPEGMTYTWQEYLAGYVGFDDRDAFRFGFRSAGKALSEERLERLIAEKERVFADLVREGDLAPYPGVRELLSMLGDAGVPTALCTGARASDIRVALAAMRLDTAFAVVVTADEVAVSKPDPESYRRCLEALARALPARAFTPERCVAVEDTPAGVTSARAAGLRVLAVTTTHSEPSLKEADRVVATVEGLSLRAMSSLVGAHPAGL